MKIDTNNMPIAVILFSRSKRLTPSLVPNIWLFSFWFGDRHKSRLKGTAAGASLSAFTKTFLGRETSFCEHG